MSLYENAHLVVAAIRVLEHRTGTAPSVENVCQTLKFSLEQGNLIIRKLEKLQIINITEGAYGTRMFIKNHMLIEQIGRESGPDRFQQELEKFRSSKKQQDEKIKSFQAQQAEKKKNLFADIEKKLKRDLEKS